MATKLIKGIAINQTTLTIKRLLETGVIIFNCSQTTRCKLCQWAKDRIHYFRYKKMFLEPLERLMQSQ